MPASCQRARVPRSGSYRAAARSPGLLRSRPVSRPASTIALDQMKIRRVRGRVLAIRQFARQRRDARAPFAPRQVPRLACSFARRGRLRSLLTMILASLRVLFKPLVQASFMMLSTTGALRMNQLVLGLGENFGSGTLTREHTGEAFARIIAGQRDFFLLQRCRLTFA